jgi:hypothetical protein
MFKCAIATVPAICQNGRFALLELGVPELHRRPPKGSTFHRLSRRNAPATQGHVSQAHRIIGKSAVDVCAEAATSGISLAGRFGKFDVLAPKRRRASGISPTANRSNEHPADP